jgi:predicted RNA-binding Zn ribbon-like protein
LGLEEGEKEAVSGAGHRRALELRSALRSFLQLSAECRAEAPERVKTLKQMIERYPLVVSETPAAIFTLQPAAEANGLGKVVTELFRLAESGRLDRLKICDSAECQWVYFDRSKPGNRRWCSSQLCGNKQKRRDYRKRLKTSAPSGGR